MTGRRSIDLKPISNSMLRQALNVWDEDFSYHSERALSLPDANPLRILFIRNRTNAVRPIRSILSCVIQRFNAFAILEDPYMDLDFWDSHSNFYDSSFSKYTVECQRLHFFSGDESVLPELIDRLLAGHDESVLSALSMTYCGYCVLRPTPAFVIGRTALRFDSSPSREIEGKVRIVEAEKNTRPYLNVSQICVANVLGARFEITTPEFVQQDPNLGRCATASLWMTTKAMTAHYGTNRYQYSTITRQAIGGWNREREVNIVFDPTDIDSGLSVSEMRNALSQTGAGSHVFSPSDGESPESAFLRVGHEVYSFLESQMPVLLCLDNPESKQGHVVVAVGNAKKEDCEIDLSMPISKIRSLGPQMGAQHYLVGNQVKLYYAHDDAYGPFNRVHLIEGVNRKEEVGENIPMVLAKLGSESKDFHLRQVLVAVPKYVRNYATQPLAQLIGSFEESGYGKGITKEHGVFLWRSLLIEGAAFKRSVFIREYPDAIKKRYATLHLPKYVWLYEVFFVPTTVVDGKKAALWKPEIDTEILGEFLFDATSPSYDVRPISERFGNLFRIGLTGEIEDGGEIKFVERFSWEKLDQNQGKKK